MLILPKTHITRDIFVRFVKDLCKNYVCIFRRMLPLGRVIKWHPYIKIDLKKLIIDGCIYLFINVFFFRLLKYNVTVFVNYLTNT